jgi:hypothetical protein
MADERTVKKKLKKQKLESRIWRVVTKTPPIIIERSFQQLGT